MAGEPYLSVVVTARNDHHGGNLLGRMQIFVAGWIQQARRHGIPCELIIVEWNPPQDRPRLIDVLRWPEDTGPCEVRFIEVPPELHARFPHGDTLPLYQMAAKNAGIRRARGQFVLATNIDILFSDELAEHLAARCLEHGRMYRIDRHDAMSAVPVDAPVAEQLAYCAAHLIRINTREGTFSVTPDGQPVVNDGDIASPEAGILFGRGWSPPTCIVPPEVFRWAGNLAEIHLATPVQPGLALMLDLEPGPSAGGSPLLLEVEAAGQPVSLQTLDCRRRLRVAFDSKYPGRLLLRTHGAGVQANEDPRPLNFRVFRIAWEASGATSHGAELETSLQPLPRFQKTATLWHSLRHLLRKLAEGGPLVRLTVPVSPRMRRLLKRWNATAPATRTAPGSPETHPAAADFLHTNACGDFTLMAREHWFDLRGYPEMDLFSMNLDQLFCFAAHYGGAREELLTDPMRIYHIEHSSGSGWTPEGQAELFARIASKGLSFIEDGEILRMAAQMRRLGAPMIFNHEDWGLSGIELKETRVQR